MEKEDMESQWELISEKVEEHKYHIIRFVSNSISKKLKVNDRRTIKVYYKHKMMEKLKQMILTMI